MSANRAVSDLGRDLANLLADGIVCQSGLVGPAERDDLVLFVHLCPVDGGCDLSDSFDSHSSFWECDAESSDARCSYLTDRVEKFQLGLRSVAIKNSSHHD
jgi:hypothetical protein